MLRRCHLCGAVRYSCGRAERDFPSRTPLRQATHDSGTVAGERANTPWCSPSRREAETVSDDATPTLWSYTPWRGALKARGRSSDDVCIETKVHIVGIGCPFARRMFAGGAKCFSKLQSGAHDWTRDVRKDRECSKRIGSSAVCGTVLQSA